MNIWTKFGIIVGALAGTAAASYAVRKSPELIDAIKESSRDTDSASPADLSKSDWKRALKETKSALGDKNIPMLAAGVAFFSTLAFFPTIAAFVSIFSLLSSPEQVTAAVTAVENYLPREMAGLVNMQLQASAGKQTANLIAASIAISLALFGASSGVQNLIKATNEAYDVDESRGFIKLKLISIALVFGGIIAGIPLLLLLIVQASWLTDIGAPGWLADGFLIFRWLIVTILMIIALAVFYRYGPDQKKAKWQWVSWGAVAAIIIWLLGTLLFFFYAQNFGNFSKSYGVFAGIIVLMTWFNLSAFIILIGAQVNHRLEAQTTASTRD